MGSCIAEDSRKLGKILREYRKTLNLTQIELADQAGLLQKTISSIESDAATAKVSTLFKMLSALKLELELKIKLTDQDN